MTGTHQVVTILVSQILHQRRAQCDPRLKARLNDVVAGELECRFEGVNADKSR
jgi:hypothetical protein